LDCDEIWRALHTYRSVNLTHEGVSIDTYIRRRSWRQRWSKDEAISLVDHYLRRGEWTPFAHHVAGRWGGKVEESSTWKV